MEKWLPRNDGCTTASYSSLVASTRGAFVCLPMTLHNPGKPFNHAKGRGTIT